jgi:hypothetical protein
MKDTQLRRVASELGIVMDVKHALGDSAKGISDAGTFGLAAC